MASRVPDIRHIVIRRERANPCFWEKSEKLADRGPLILKLVVMVSTVSFFALFSMLTDIKLIALRVILLLFPAMAIRAPVLIWTPISVALNYVLTAPVGTLLVVVRKLIRVAPKVLPVVGKDTLVSLMLLLVVGAPHCLEVE
jgi:hypothetical protein